MTRLVSLARVLPLPLKGLTLGAGVGRGAGRTYEVDEKGREWSWGQGPKDRNLKTPNPGALTSFLHTVLSPVSCF